MFERFQKTVSVCALSFATACGGGDLEVYNNSDDDGSTTATTGETQGGMTSGGETDSGTPIVDAPDMGTAPDVGTPDTGADAGPDPDPDPMTNVPQTGPSVAEQITNSCSTRSVRPLSTQLVDQMNCLSPGIMKSFAGAPSISYGDSVFPYQQGPATDVFTAVAANNSGTIPVNSALRMIPGQYLLYEWYVRGLCNANLAARPGQSNHNGGLAIDIGNSSTWRSRLRAQNYIDNVSGEPWHFAYQGAGGQDVRNLAVLAFQQLYNFNFPEDPIDEDGVYGPQTESALRASPAEGFAVVPTCTMSLDVGYPWGIPMDLEWELLGDGVLGIQANVPNGVQLIEYYVDGELIGFADRDVRRFESVLELPHDAETLRVEAVAYDHEGTERGREFGFIEVRDENQFGVRPLGGHNFELGFDLPSEKVRSVEIYVDGVLTSSLPPSRKLNVHLEKAETLGVVLLDRRGRVLEVRDLEL